MVALSRLKATFEAWKCNFRGLYWTFGAKYENTGLRLTKEWHVETAPPCEAHRAPSKEQDGCARYSTLLRKQHATAENARARTPSVSVSCACSPRIWSWRGKKTSFFGKVTVAWAEAYGQPCHSLVSPQVQRWPCGYSPSIQSRSLLDVPCHCSFT